MSWFVPGNPTIDSTEALASNPSTATILAELNAGHFGSTRANRDYAVYAYLGGSTGAVWTWERVTSSNVNSTTILEQTTLYTASGQTSQFLKKFRVTGDQRIRLRHQSSLQGTFAAKLSAEEIV